MGACFCVKLLSREIICARLIWNTEETHRRRLFRLLGFPFGGVGQPLAGSRSMEESVGAGQAQSQSVQFDCASTVASEFTLSRERSREAVEIAVNTRIGVSSTGTCW